MRFSESEVRSMGRVSTGVKGIRLRQGDEDEVVDMVVVRKSSTLLTICENGYGKLTSHRPSNPSKRRAGQGVIDIKTSPRNGPVVACREIHDEEEVMVVTQNGIMIRIPVQGISTIGRNTQGVRLINLDEGDRVIDMAPLPISEDEDEDEDEGRRENGAADENASG